MEEQKYETTPLLEKAREEREKMEAANAKREELLDREEKMMARKMLGGASEAGMNEKKIPIEEKRKMDAKTFFHGTQLEKDIEQYNE